MSRVDKLIQVNKPPITGSVRLQKKNTEKLKEQLDNRLVLKKRIITRQLTEAETSAQYYRDKKYTLEDLNKYYLSALKHPPQTRSGGFELESQQPWFHRDIDLT